MKCHILIDHPLCNFCLEKLSEKDLKLMSEEDDKYICEKCRNVQAYNDIWGEFMDH
ncbi:hypothetical protein MYP_669 [Sporocytophaga myxococcoides]|uniref:Uncharacterized protein n=1 Tax=Sporocytophaga myxococcoides TaxID=153721 RepID=A0A098LAI1_9BACT|nr:hypothetical protein MYP_669 [Sporocytophaga myxococcoides]